MENKDLTVFDCILKIQDRDYSIEWNELSLEGAMMAICDIHCSIQEEFKTMGETSFSTLAIEDICSIAITKQSHFKELSLSENQNREIHIKESICEMTKTNEHCISEHRSICYDGEIVITDLFVLLYEILKAVVKGDGTDLSLQSPTVQLVLETLKSYKAKEGK